MTIFVVIFLFEDSRGSDISEVQICYSMKDAIKLIQESGRMSRIYERKLNASKTKISFKS